MVRVATQADLKAIWVGPTKVVSALDLEMHTQDGWVLLERYENSEKEYLSKQVPNPNYGNTNSNNPYNEFLICSQDEMATVSMFLIGKTEETALAESIQKEHGARAAAEEAKGANVELQKAFDELTRKADSSHATAEDRRKQLSDSAEKCRDERNRRNILEDDMAKVIARIGQREWDAAVGTSEGVA